MGSVDTDSKAVLERDEEYRRLGEKHRRCEARLQELRSRHYLSEEEQIEELRIKKEKLAIKDQMVMIERRAGTQGRQVATG
jgi:uncharacterized protein YdcH (DUF465 family)